VLPEPDGVLPEPEGVLPELDCVLPELDCVLPEPDCVLPEPDCVLPELDCVLPELDCVPDEVGDCVTKPGFARSVTADGKDAWTANRCVSKERDLAASAMTCDQDWKVFVVRALAAEVRPPNAAAARESLTSAFAWENVARASASPIAASGA
jgi:hypothetical protein